MRRARGWCHHSRKKPGRSCREEAAIQAGTWLFVFVTWACTPPIPLKPPFGRAAPSLECRYVGSCPHFLHELRGEGQPLPSSGSNWFSLSHLDTHPLLGGEFEGVQWGTPGCSRWGFFTSVLKKFLYSCCFSAWSSDLHWFGEIIGK